MPLLQSTAALPWVVECPAAVVPRQSFAAGLRHWPRGCLLLECPLADLAVQMFMSPHTAKPRSAFVRWTDIDSRQLPFPNRHWIDAPPETNGQDRFARTPLTKSPQRMNARFRPAIVCGQGMRPSLILRTVTQFAFFNRAVISSLCTRNLQNWSCRGRRVLCLRAKRIHSVHSPPRVEIVLARRSW